MYISPQCMYKAFYLRAVYILIVKHVTFPKMPLLWCVHIDWVHAIMPLAMAWANESDDGSNFLQKTATKPDIQKIVYLTKENPTPAPTARR